MGKWHKLRIWHAEVLTHFAMNSKEQGEILMSCKNNLGYVVVYLVRVRFR
jgi:hypothetical protein